MMFTMNIQCFISCIHDSNTDFLSMSVKHLTPQHPSHYFLYLNKSERAFFLTPPNNLVCCACRYSVGQL